MQLHSYSPRLKGADWKVFYITIDQLLAFMMASLINTEIMPNLQALAGSLLRI